MFAAIFKYANDGSIIHLGNVVNLKYELTRRAYDLDTFSASGKCNENLEGAQIVVLNNEDGSYVYGCYVKGITQTNGYCEIVGLDFKKWLENEFLVMNYGLNQGNTVYVADTFFRYFFNASKTTASWGVNAGSIATFNKVIIVIPPISGGYPNLKPLTGDLSIEAALSKPIGSFLKPYMAYYGYYLYPRFSYKENTQYDGLVTNTIIFTLGSFQTTPKTIRLQDFIYAESLGDSGINMTKSLKMPLSGTNYVNTFLLDINNNIYQYQGMLSGPEVLPVIISQDLIKRPLIVKMFYDESSSKAISGALTEIVNNRYSNSIVLEDDPKANPLNLSTVLLMQKFLCYREDGTSITLPVSEIIDTGNGQTKTRKIKLGFKKMFLTDIIRGGK